MDEGKSNIISFKTGAFEEAGMKKEMGKVTPEERDEIKGLFERRNGLTELAKSLSSLSRAELESSALYDKLIQDTGKVNIQFQAWWDRMSQQYKWENRPGHRWEIDFDTCTVYIRSE